MTDHTDQAEGQISLRFPPPSPLEIYQGANLPHWRRDAARYSVTFRLADSLPQEVLIGWKNERQGIILRTERMGRPLSDLERKRLDELHSERIEKWLDQGHGLCHLSDKRIASLVQNAILHFHATRYELLAWCLMPNHVHAVLRTFPQHDLSKVLHSWKSFTSSAARKILGCVGAGEFWQRESYDHLIRDEQDLAHHIRHVLNNPAAAGLTGWPWVGKPP